MNNYWVNGMIGVAVADAFGSPVQFMDRERLKKNPLTVMEYCEIYEKPAGAWTDDTSMALCILDSLRKKGKVDTVDIMGRFSKWMYEDEYTPTGEAFDMGNTCVSAIERYRRTRDVNTCGRTGEHANGNGSLMRNMPICIYYAEKTHKGSVTVDEAIADIHRVSALTHNHLRACMACGLYFFLVREMIFGEGSFQERLQKGLDCGFAYYEKDITNRVELSRYGRMRNISAFRLLPEDQIRSTGYVVDTLEAAVWSLANTDSYRDCVIRAVNLGDDTDSVGAVAGGIAGLYYGYDAIPADWRAKLLKREWIEKMCRDMAKR